MVTRLILKNFVNILRIHCVKSVQIFSGTEKYGPKKLRIWTILTQSSDQEVSKS